MKLETVIPAAITEAYTLNGISVLTQFESYGNENWLIDDEGGQRYVLRRNRLNSDVRRIEFQLELQRHLMEHGFPTSKVVETGSQSQFAIDHEGVPWILFSYVAGNEFDFARRQQVTEAARSLARFHLITESLQREAPGPEYKASIRACWANAEKDLVELTDLFEGDGVEDELAYLSARWRTVLNEWPVERLDGLPSGWLHGDFHGRNLAFHGDRVVGVFDFDDVDTGPYVHDVGDGVVKFGRERRGSAKLRASFARAFIEGYETLRPLSEEERAVLPVMCTMGHPPHPRNYRFWRDQRGEDIRHRFRREIRTMRALEAEMERIGPALRN